MNARAPALAGLEAGVVCGKSAPAGLEITVRDLRFARDGQVRRWWLGGNPVASAWFNALSATFPRGEAFFIESVKAFREGVPPELERDIRAFIIQEVNHTREHVAFNRLASEAGFDLARIDKQVEEDMAMLKGRPRILDLASTMALEHFTAILAHDLLVHPETMAGADPEAAALWRWHAIEEIEHKAVAYDTFLHATRDWSRWRRWKLKALMMLVITGKFIPRRIADTLHMLGEAGISGWKTRWQVLGYLFWSPGVVRRLIPAWLAYFMPGFPPWNLDDHALIAQTEAELAARG